MSIQIQPHRAPAEATCETRPTLKEKAKEFLIEPFLRQGLSPQSYCLRKAQKDPAQFTDPNAMSSCIKSAQVYRAYLDSSFPN